MSTGEIFQELYLDEQHNSLPAGARIGPLVVAPYLQPVDPATQKVVPGGMEEHLRAVFQNMDRVLHAGGATRGDVARITLFIRTVSDRTAMNKVYKEWYPDEMDRPPHKYVPVELPEGIEACAQVIAIPGSARRVIEIPGIHHQDWMSLSGLQGNLVTSSRVFGTDPATGKGSPDAEEHTAIVFRNVDTILQMAGGSWQDVTQLTAFFVGDGLKPTIEKAWRERVGQTADAPPLHLLETTLGGQVRPDGQMLPRLEVLAVL